MTLPQQVKGTVDGLAIGTWVAAMAGWLPAIAALVSIVWGCIRIYETRTMQRLLGKQTKTRKEDRV